MLYEGDMNCVDEEDSKRNLWEGETFWRASPQLLARFPTWTVINKPDEYILSCILNSIFLLNFAWAITMSKHLRTSSLLNSQAKTHKNDLRSTSLKNNPTIQFQYKKITEDKMQGEALDFAEFVPLMWPVKAFVNLH